MPFAAIDDGAIYALIDNGFGSKATPPTRCLASRGWSADFETGAVGVQERIWLSDPDHNVPFRIVHEATEARYLTGRISIRGKHPGSRRPGVHRR
jgi:hypothetical protein